MGRIFIYLLVIFMDYLPGISNLYQKLNSILSSNPCPLLCTLSQNHTYMITSVFPHPFTMSPWKAGLSHNHFYIYADSDDVWFA